jgi:methylmalonyl-CoA mutase C-terminal domain/subunit
MSSKRPIRVLIVKPGLDGHDKGAKIVARSLKDAGMEVIYTGIRQTVDAIVRTAIQEDVDVIGLSILSGTHLTICRELMEKMEKQGINDKIVTVGGIIPKKDVNRLMEFGIAKVFRPSDTTSAVTGFIKGEVQRREK